MLYVVRHGRTPLNAEGLLRGRLDPPLDAVGEAEARALGRCFAGTALDAVVTSPLQRSVATARAIADTTGTDVTVDPDLVDRDYGPWAGTSREAVEAAHGSVDLAPGVEPWTVFAARVVAAARRHGSRGLRTVLVAHDAVNRAILGGLTEDVDRTGASLPQRTGCWNRLERIGDRWVATVIDARPDDGPRP